MCAEKDSGVDWQVQNKRGGATRRCTHLQCAAQELLHCCQGMLVMATASRSPCHKACILLLANGKSSGSPVTISQKAFDDALFHSTRCLHMAGQSKSSCGGCFDQQIALQLQKLNKADTFAFGCRLWRFTIWSSGVTSRSGTAKAPWPRPASCICHVSLPS